MQLDQTRIAIRPRGISELLDLGLLVFRYAFRPLMISLLLPMIPMFLFNAYSLHWILAEEQSNSTRSHYLVSMVMAIFLETPFVTLPATIVLGRIMFLEPITFRAIVDVLRDRWGHILWTLGCVRGSLWAIIALALIVPDYDMSASEAWMGILVVYQGLLRAVRPYLAEIVVLERSPWRSANKLAMTIRRRSALLHNTNGSDLVSRSISMAITNTVLAINLILSFWFLIGIFTSQWTWGWFMMEIAIPVAFWITAIYATIVRFLSYIDLRIRREGWEVELKMRAAGDELRGHAA